MYEVLVTAQTNTVRNVPGPQRRQGDQRHVDDGVVAEIPPVLGESEVIVARSIESVVAKMSRVCWSRAAPIESLPCLKVQRVCQNT